jgi:ligand-binding sensor domain-containing protein
LLWLATSARAQRPADYETISTDRGLSQGMVFDMIQDREGFIWIGTKEGLNRYDGYTFKIFTNDPYDPTSISSNNIRTLFEDSKGRIWANSLDAGINVYDRRTGRFRRIMHQEGNPNGLSSNRISTATLELSDGRILLGTGDNALTLISLPVDFFGRDSVPAISTVILPDSAHVYGIGEDDKGVIWVGCQDKRIYFFDTRANTFELVSDGKIFTAAVSKGGTKIWSNMEVLHLDSAVPYRPFDSAGQLVPGVLMRTSRGRISLNRLGDLPTATSQSYYYGMESWKPGMRLHRAVTQSIKGAVVDFQSVMVDRSGIVWVGTLGLGLRKYNLAAGRFHFLFPNFSVRNILPLSGDRLFLGGWMHDQWVRSDGGRVVNPVSRQLVANHYMNFLVSRAGD